GLAQPLEHADSVKAGHDQIKHEGGDRTAIRPGQDRKAVLATPCLQRTVAGTSQRRVEQTALHGIVVDDEYGRRHACVPSRPEFGLSGSLWHNLLKGCPTKAVNESLPQRGGPEDAG